MSMPVDENVVGFSASTGPIRSQSRIAAALKRLFPVSSESSQSRPVRKPTHWKSAQLSQT